MADLAEIGVFGGSGFYTLLDDVREAKVDTPYGPPSDSVFLATIAGRRVAFLPRHGAATRSRRTGSTTAPTSGRCARWASRPSSARAPPARSSSHVEPGHFVVCDQFVDRTTGREDTFFDGPIVPHVSSAETYDPTLRGIALDVIREHGITVHDGGTVVVIQGPRFSTRAESKWFSDAGWEVINMTQYPEAYLCRELGHGRREHRPDHRLRRRRARGHEAVTAHDVLAVFEQNAERIRERGAGHGRPVPGGPRRARRARRARATRGATATSPAPADIRIFETGLLAAARMTSMPTTPTPAAAPAPSEPMHGCVRCGARIPISESMCERVQPAGPQVAVRVAGAWHGDPRRRRSPSCCSRSSPGSRSAASARSRRAWSAWARTRRASG